MFFTILNMNIAACCMILIILGIRAAFRRMPHRMVMVLWGLVALRLLCPVMLQSGIGLLPGIGMSSPVQEGTKGSGSGYSPGTADPQSGKVPYSDPVSTDHEGVNQEAPYETEQSGKGTTISKTSVITVIWLTGTCLVLAYTTADYIKVYKKVKDAHPIGCGRGPAGNLYWDNGSKGCESVLISSNIETPMLFGLFKPYIYLPAEVSERDRNYVIRHERMHLQYGDHWWKLLGVLVLALHWFNPLVWAAFAALSRDIEYACDEAVIRSLDRDGRRRYAHCLIDCSTINNHWGIVSLSFGKDVTKMRVKNIINYTEKKKGLWVALGVVVCLIAVLFFTTRASATDDPGATPKRPEVQQDEVEFIDANGKDVRANLEATEAFARLDKVLSGDSEEFKNLREGYGGGYIAEDGVLVVGFKNVSQDEIDRVKVAAGLQNVRFVEAAYTYQELEQIQKSVNEYLQGVYKVTPNTAEIRFTTAIDQELNGIDIDLTAVEDAVYEAIKAEFADVPCRITMNDAIWVSEELASRQ